MNKPLNKSITIDNIVYDLSSIEGEIKENERMSKHTTWKVGGAAQIYFKPQSRSDLQNFLKLIINNHHHNNNKHQILFIGLGSNVLFRDKGYKGIIINTVGKLKQIKFEHNETIDHQDFSLVSTDSGVSCAKFSREMANSGLLGAEFFSGIPGSMGGAIAMNAGAFGYQCWDNIDYVETIDEKGIIHKRDKQDFAVSYREVKGLNESSKGCKEWFIKGYFKYAKNIDQVKRVKQKIKKLLDKRNKTQPIQYANAGSVFKNPPGDYAARLIETCGLKGTQIGGASISEKHANFIINNGQGSAADIEALIEHIKIKVDEKYALKLETEVKIYGEQ